MGKSISIHFLEHVQSVLFKVSTVLTESAVLLCLQAVSYSSRGYTDERHKPVVRLSERRDVYPKRLEGAVRETAAWNWLLHKSCLFFTYRLYTRDFLYNWSGAHWLRYVSAIFTFGLSSWMKSPLSCSHPCTDCYIGFNLITHTHCIWYNRLEAHTYCRTFYYRKRFTSKHHKRLMFHHVWATLQSTVSFQISSSPSSGEQNSGISFSTLLLHIHPWRRTWRWRTLPTSALSSERITV